MTTTIEYSTATSPIPKKLLRSPRRVRRKPGTLGLLLLGRILTAPVVGAAVLLLAVAIIEPIVVFLLPSQPAQIVGLSRELKSHRGLEYYVQYRFVGSGFTGRDQVLAEEYQSLKIGQTTNAHLIHLGQIGYSSLDRSVGAYVRYRLILWFGVLFGSTIGGVLFYAIWLLPWRSHWLARHGTATFGAVVAKGISHSGRRHVSFNLTYQYRAHRTLRARRIRISPQRFESADVKDLVIILFDPKRPSRSIIYDYCDFVAFR